MGELPIVCSLTPEALQARREGLLAALVRRADIDQESADGRQLRFPGDAETLGTLIRAVNAERHCCRFLRFQITIEPDEGPIWLELTGPPGTREFLASLLGA